MSVDKDIKVESATIMLMLLIAVLWSIDRFQHDRIEKALARVEQKLEQCK